MARIKKIKDNPDLVKDTSSQAVINTNSSAIHNRRAQMAQQKIREEELQQMKAILLKLRN